MTTEDPTILYKPADVSKVTLDAIEERQSSRGKGVTTGVPEVDDVLKPIRPGELVTIVALSSNWKTGFMQHMARREAARLDPVGDECVLYVTWEVTVEECGLLDLANATGLDIADLADGNVADLDQLKRAAIQRGTLPLYVFGHSLARRKKRPVLSMTAVAQAVLWLEDRLNLRVRLACLDFLQAMETEGKQDMRLEVAANVDRAKNMAYVIGAPVLLGCQAKQEIFDREWKLPRMNDGMESSKIMHASDKIIGLWRPVATEGPNAEIGPDGNRIPVTEDLLLMGVAKNRFGQVGNWWPLSVDFGRNHLRGLMDYKTVDLRGVP